MSYVESDNGYSRRRTTTAFHNWDYSDSYNSRIGCAYGYNSGSRDCSRQQCGKWNSRQAYEYKSRKPAHISEDDSCCSDSAGAVVKYSLQDLMTRMSDLDNKLRVINDHSPLFSEIGLDLEKATVTTRGSPVLVDVPTSIREKSLHLCTSIMFEIKGSSGSVPNDDTFTVIQQPDDELIAQWTVVETNK